MKSYPGAKMIFYVGLPDHENFFSCFLPDRGASVADEQPLMAVPSTWRPFLA